MKNLIYQYWDGDLKPGVKASVKAVKQYADRIGAKHIFEHNPRWRTNLGAYSIHYGSFKPVVEWGDDYENILFLDSDIFPVEGLEENIFDNMDFEIGICTEPFQPKQRTITTGQITSARDEQWASLVKRLWDVDLPREEKSGLLKVYNSGVVLYSSKGIQKFKEFMPFKEYVNAVKGLISFYSSDQNYIHCMLTHANVDYVELDNGWNSYIHGTKDIYQPQRRLMDWRDENSKFVHCQFAGGLNLSEEQLHKIVNLPREDWGFDWK